MARYQVRFNVLQAGAYGAPQSRVRLIILAARLGYPLPEMPTPTHAFNTRKWSIDLTDGYRVQCPSSDYAPFEQVTVDKAISDLPIFHWYVTLFLLVPYLTIPPCPIGKTRHAQTVEESMSRTSMGKMRPSHIPLSPPAGIRSGSGTVRRKCPNTSPSLTAMQWSEGMLPLPLLLPRPYLTIYPPQQSGSCPFPPCWCQLDQ